MELSKSGTPGKLRDLGSVQLSPMGPGRIHQDGITGRVLPKTPYQCTLRSERLGCVSSLSGYYYPLVQWDCASGSVKVPRLSFCLHSTQPSWTQQSAWIYVSFVQNSFPEKWAHGEFMKKFPLLIFSRCCIILRRGRTPQGLKVNNHWSYTNSCPVDPCL